MVSLGKVRSTLTKKYQLTMIMYDVASGNLDNLQLWKRFVPLQKYRRILVSFFKGVGYMFLRGKKDLVSLSYCSEFCFEIIWPWY